ncbi:hypothetical protein TNIN_252191 [Trichonephila inaurata madagascariensis]|uniref:Uncharacterized protein n=1 Tax=Trichonephila inaurata madagascariensis TaxID=2747483 RepID=A0A8X6WM03_9ARAC|nr:hypothetical protein TNIN_252191 [Trichonephila inaurata madagascariensis]
MPKFRRNLMVTISPGQNFQTVLSAVPPWKHGNVSRGEKRKTSSPNQVSDPKQTFPPLAACLTTLSRSSCCTDQSPADDKESARGGPFLIIDIRTMSIHDGR